MQNISRDCHRRVLPGKRHSGRALYAKAQSEPYAREENTTAAGLPATQKKQSAPAILSVVETLGKKYGSMSFDDQSAADPCAKTLMGSPDRPNTPTALGQLSPNSDIR
jgi:hypothetical protein